MGAEERPGSAGLIEGILQEAPRYSFFQLVNLLERFAAAEVGVGRQGPPGREVIRFRSYKSLAFQTADVMSVAAEEDDRGRSRWAIETTFLGLYGTTSPLPSFYTEEILHEASQESLVQGFLDLFNHRLVSLLYRCWEKYRYYMLFRGEGDDEFSRRMMYLTGLGSAWWPEDAAVPRARMLRYAGLLIVKPRPAAALRAIVADYFDGLPTQVEPFAVRWVNIAPESQNRLGALNATLGVDLHAGEQVLDRSGKFRVRIGALGLERFLSFLPHERNFHALDEIVRLYVTDQLENEVEVILRREEIPSLQIAEGSPGARLGQTTWLGRPEADAHVVFQQPVRRGSGFSDSLTERRAAAAAA